MAAINYPSAILFDLDGTLVDTALDFYGVVNQLRQETGLLPLADDLIRQQVSNGGVALASLTYEISKDHPDIWSFRQRVLDRYERIIGTHSDLFDGFAGVLNELQERSLKWSIVTNKPRLYTDLLLQKLAIKPASVVCPEDVERPKPAADALLLSASQLGVDPDRCWYVGDHVRDMDAARAANMAAIAVSFGYIESGDQITEWPHDVIINQPGDLLTLLDQCPTNSSSN